MSLTTAGGLYWELEVKVVLGQLEASAESQTENSELDDKVRRPSFYNQGVIWWKLIYSDLLLIL